MESAGVQIWADFSKQSWFALSGAIDGQLTVQAGPIKKPDLIIDLSGTNLNGYSLKSVSLQLKGELKWPWLDLRSWLSRPIPGPSAEAGQSPGSSAEINGRINLQTRMISEGSIRAAGDWGNEILPDGYSFERAVVTAKFSGPHRSLQHSGNGQIGGIVAPKMPVLNLESE